MNGGLYEKEFYKKCLNYLLGLRLTVKAPWWHLRESLMFIDEAGSRVLLMDAEKVALPLMRFTITDIILIRLWNQIGQEFQYHRFKYVYPSGLVGSWMQSRSAMETIATTSLSFVLPTRWQNMLKNYSKLSAHDRHEALETANGLIGIMIRRKPHFKNLLCDIPLWLFIAQSCSLFRST